MASITIRGLDDAVKAQLHLRAARHGRSIEEEACEILTAALSAMDVPRLNLAESIRQYVKPLGGVELALPPRVALRRPPKLER
jgi:antitoxin FitA